MNDPNSSETPDSPEPQQESGKKVTNSESADSSFNEAEDGEVLNAKGEARAKFAWRLIPMIAALIAAEIAATILGIVTLVQVVHTLVVAEVNQELRIMSNRLVEYLRQLYRYVTYQSDEPVFPFAPFPQARDTIYE